MPKDRRGSRQPNYDDDETYDDARSLRGNGSMLHLAEGLIQKFSGNDDGENAVTSWMREIDDNGDIFNWSPTQRLLVARRSLTGTAALWLRSEKTYKSWDELKTAISKEFPDTADAKKIHEMMSSRRKRRNESCLDFMLTMKALGKRGKLPDYVAIKYIIEGIDDAEINKVMLYGVTTYADLKEKLKIYEAIRVKTKPSNIKRDQHSSGGGGYALPRQANIHKAVRFNRCYNCGDAEHLSAECPHRSLGKKCFNCNQFGHLSANCKLGSLRNKEKMAESSFSGARPRPLPEYQDKNYEVSRSETKHVLMSMNDSDSIIQQETVHSPAGASDTGDTSDSVGKLDNCKDGDVNNLFAKSERPLKDIMINGRLITSLIDSGSDLNLISSKCCDELGLLIKKDLKIKMSGFGSSKVESIGTTDVLINVDGNYYSDSFHVIPTVCMPYKLILGNEFLCKVVTVMKGGFVWVNPEWLSNVNCFVCFSDCLGHISNQSMKEEVMQLVDNYQPCQIREAPIQLRIFMKDEVPVAQRPRRISPKEQNEVERQVNEWLQDGIIRRKTSNKLLND